MTRRLVGLIVSALVLVTGICSAGTLTFNNYYDYVYTSASVAGNTKVVSANAWTITLNWDVAGDGADVWALNDDDVLIGGSTVWNPGFDGIMGNADITMTDANIADGNLFFIRVFDGAGQAVNLDMVEDNDGLTYGNYNATRVYTDPGTGIVVWNPATGGYVGGSDPNGANDWYAVPEPSTLALFGIGAVTLAFRRRKARKS